MSHNFSDFAAFQPIASPDLLRLGRAHDGGYVVPKSSVIAADGLLSLGVNLDWSFEQSLLDLKPGLKVVCVDGTTGLTRAITRAVQKCFDALGHALTFKLKRVKGDLAYLFVPFGFYRFFSKHPLVKAMVGDGKTAETVSLETLYETHLNDCRSIYLKMDIEGSEFSVFPLSPAIIEKTCGMVVEFHDLEKNWSKFAQAVGQLQEHFYVAHIHANNYGGPVDGTRCPRAVELSFIKRSLVPGSVAPSTRAYPIQGLDMPCDPKHPDIEIRFVI